MFEIFSRLNSGGVILKPQEIRMSLFYSPFYDKLMELNLNVFWRKFLGKDTPDLHMGEAEVLLRAFAMLEMYDCYKSPMRAFLNVFSEKAKKFHAEKIEELAKNFNDFWSSCAELDVNCFKNERGRFVISLFEAIFVAVCEDIRAQGLNNRKIVRESVAKLKRDTVFIDASQQRTADRNHVLQRINKAKEYIILQ